MLKQAFAIGLLGTLGLVSAGADASDYGYRAPPPPAYVRPGYYPRPAYYPRYVYPAYARGGWYGGRYCPPVRPAYGYRAPLPRHWNGRPPYHGGGYGKGHDNGRGQHHGGGNWNRH